MKKKRIYIIPGFGESTRCKNYKELKLYARKSNFIVVPINIEWDTEKDMSDYINEADQKIPNNIQNDYIFGFSFGSYIAGVLSIKKQAKGFIFSSISPYFKNDLKHIPQESKEYFGKKMMKSFEKYTFPNKSISHAWFLVGEKDWSIAIKKMSEIYKIWKGKKEKYIIKTAGHSLVNKSYTKQLQQIIKKL